MALLGNRPIVGLNVASLPFYYQKQDGIRLNFCTLSLEIPSTGFAHAIYVCTFAEYVRHGRLAEWLADMRHSEDTFTTQTILVDGVGTWTGSSRRNTKLQNLPRTQGMYVWTRYCKKPRHRDAEDYLARNRPEDLITAHRDCSGPAQKPYYCRATWPSLAILGGYVRSISAEVV